MGKLVCYKSYLLSNTIGVFYNLGDIN